MKTESGAGGTRLPVGPQPPDIRAFIALCVSIDSSEKEGAFHDTGRHTWEGRDVPTNIHRNLSMVRVRRPGQCSAPRRANPTYRSDGKAAEVSVDESSASSLANSMARASRDVVDRYSGQRVAVRSASVADGSTVSATFR